MSFPVKTNRCLKILSKPPLSLHVPGWKFLSYFANIATFPASIDWWEEDEGRWEREGGRGDGYWMCVEVFHRPTLRVTYHSSYCSWLTLFLANITDNCVDRILPTAYLDKPGTVWFQKNVFFSLMSMEWKYMTQEIIWHKNLIFQKIVDRWVCILANDMSHFNNTT